MDIVQEGIIIRIEGDYARINVQVHSSCAGCGACGSPEIELLAHNPVKAIPGQKVKFISRGNMFKISFILFMFPLISIFTGVYLGFLAAHYFHMNSMVTMLSCSLFLFFISIFCIAVYDRKYKLPDNLPEIVEIIS